MNNVTFVEVPNLDGTTTEHAIIDHGNEAFSSMTKAHYEAQQVEHLTEIVPASD